MLRVPIFANGAQTAAIQYLFNQASDAFMRKDGWKKGVHQFATQCDNPSDCVREVEHKVEFQDRYEELPKLTSPSKKFGWLEGATLTVDAVTSGYRKHYVDEVQYYYTERLHTIQEYWTNSEGRYVGGVTRQAWIPEGPTNSRVINSSYQGIVRDYRVPFGQR